MKKLLALLAMGLCLLPQTRACDICGCASGNNYMGILPQYSKNLIGLRYYQSSFTVRHLPSLLTGQSEGMGQDKYANLELYGRIYPLPRLQLLGFLPYHRFSSTDDDVETKVKGLGDARLIANYVLVNTGDSLGHALKHTWLAGAGVKLPTGAFSSSDENTVLSPNMQPGSGSWDFLLNTIYTLRYRRVGLNTNISYSFNGTNADNYAFGNRLSTDARFFYWRNVKQFSFLPNAGISYEYAAKDTENGISRKLTGGTLLAGAVGVDVYYKRLVFNLNYQYPLSQHLSEGYVTAKPLLMAGVQILFKNLSKKADDE